MSNTPSKAEIEALAQQHLKAFTQFSLGEVWFEGEVEFARAVLAKWAAPQQEAQEPVAWLNPWRADLVTTDYDAYGEHGIPLYTAPNPAPAPLSEREAFEAWIKKEGGDLGTFGALPNMHYRNSAVNNAWVAWKARAALAAQGGK